MMQSSFRRVVLSAVVVLSACVLLVVHGNVVSSTGSQAPLPVSASQNTPSITINAEKPGGPWLRLQEGRDLEALYATQTVEQTLAAREAHPLTMATGDLDSDGYLDLLVGYGDPNGGVITVHLGDPEAFSPSKPETIDGIRQSSFRDPFVRTAAVFAIPDTPDFVASGDFDRDGRHDIVIAARGSTRLLLISGNGKGGFEASATVALPGRVTALLAERKNLSDSYSDLVVAIDGSSGARLLIYDAKESVLDAAPTTVDLPSAASSLSQGYLDDEPAADLAIVANERLYVLHGELERTGADGHYERSSPGVLSAVNLPFGVRSVTLGEFIWDRESRTEIAALGADGNVRILARGALDTRPFSEEEIRANRIMLQQIRDGERSGDVPFRQRGWRWNVVDEIYAGEAAVLETTRASALPADDLLVMDDARHEIQIINSGQVIGLNTHVQPIAVLPMRLNVMAQPGLVVLQKGKIEPTLVMVVPEVAFAVTKSTDTNDGVCNVDCSLREAIVASNSNGVADVITFNAGINPTLTITSAGLSENAAATGDLDINGSLTITGNSPTTISTTYTNTCGDCKIFGVNQTGAFSGLAISFSGLTVQNGFNNGAGFAGTFFETGGGIDFFLTGSGNTFSISNSTITNNTATGSNLSHGGGLNVDSANTATPAGPSAGTVTLTNLTVTNNTAARFGGGMGLSADKHDVTMTNPIVTGNTSQNEDGGGMRIAHSFGGTVSVSGVSGLVQNNTAAQGGGISVGFNTVTNINDITVNNNTANGTGAGSSSGGGVIISTLGAVGVTGSTTLTAVSITNNHADNDSGGGGGVSAGGFYIATLTNCTITGNTALIGNGGGVLNQGFSQTPTPTFAISGGVIRGNSVTGDGINTGFGGGFAAVGTGNPNPSSVTTLTNVAIGGASAGQPNSAVSGGAIGNMNTSTTTVGGTSTIYGNTATSRGGGIFMSGIGANPTVNNAVTINNNVPVGGTTAGQGNSAPNGGGVYLNIGTFNYTATSGNNIAGNSATTSGGGVFTNAGTANLSAITITGNTATNGSAIHTAGGATNLSGVSNVTGDVNAAGGTTTFSGTLNITGNVSIAGGTLVGASGNTTILAGNFSESGGAFTGNNSTFNISGNFAYTAGTFTAGTNTFNFNGSGAQSISASSPITFFNLSDANVTQPLTINNSINVNGTLTANGSNTILNPAAAAVIGGSGTLTGTGTARVTRATGTNDFLTQYTITNKTLTNLLIDYVGPGAQGISGTTYTNVRLNNASGGTLSAPATVNGILTLAAGAFNVGTSTLTLNSVITSTGGTLTSGATGTVIYNQSSNGQVVLAGQYGNLTFSAFDKVLPSSGTVFISGTFTPGGASGHTITGSTIDFNGAGAQTIPAFNYNNLTISGARGANNVTLVNGGTIGIAGTFSPTATFAGGNYIVTNNTINFNGSGGQTIPAFNYNNLTSSNVGARTLANSGIIGIAAVFTPGGNTYTITGSTVMYNGAAAQILPPSFTTYNNLTLNNPTTVTGFAGLTVQGLLRVQAGTFTSSSTYNNVQIDPGATLAGTAATTINVSGNWTNNGTFTANTNTVNFNGTVAQTIGGTSPTTFNNLTINNAAGINLGAAATVNGTLTLTNGNITTGANLFTIGTAGTVSRTSGHIIGTLRKNFAGPGPMFEMPVGTVGTYSPLNVTVTAGSGQLTSSVSTGVPAVLAPNSARTLQRYWTLSGTGITSNLTFNYVDGDVPGPPNNENIWNIIRVTGTTAVRYPPTFPNVVMNPAGNQFSIGGVSSYSDWTAGEPLAPTAANASVSGRVVDSDGRGIGGARVSMQNQTGGVLSALTNAFGYYSFDSVPSGQTYLVSVQHKRYAFQSQTVTVNEDVAGLNFVGEAARSFKPADGENLSP